MKKRNSGRSTSSTPKIQSSTFDEVQKKILNSPALNGGFETLLYKIDKIEESQGQLVSKVDKIHDAIYDPNDGIFSKLSEYKLENTQKVNDVTQQISEIQIWKDNKEREEMKLEVVEDKTKEKISSLEKSVDSLVRNKNNVWAVMKWFMVAIGGGVITLFIKWIESGFK